MILLAAGRGSAINELELTDVLYGDGEPPDWFEIAGDDRQFVEASAVIDGETVVVSSETVPAPVAVRFAWHTAAEPNLVNEPLGLWVEMTQLDADISGGKAPIHWLARPIALFRPGGYFVAQRVDVGYPPIQTLS